MVRSQKARYTLYVPVGKAIRLAPSSKGVIYDIPNITNTRDREMLGETWLMTEKGLIRAKNWAKTLKHVQFDAVYSTNYNRTKETAQPIVDAMQLEITIYDPRKINLKHFLKDTRGKTVFVVGHSNTIPNLVNSLIVKKKYNSIEDTNNSNLYIVIKQYDYIVDQILVVD